MRRRFYAIVCRLRRIWYLVIRARLNETQKTAYKMRTRQIEGVAMADGVVLSYPKSGRTWVELMLSRLYVRRLGLPESRVLEFEEDRFEFPDIPYLYFTHDYAHVVDGQWLLPEACSRRYFRRARTLFIVRNPIDVAVSMYFQLSRRDRYDVNMPIFDFVRGHKGGLVTAIEFMNRWAVELPRIERHHVVRYEDLAADTVSQFTAIVRFFGLDFGDVEIRDAVAFASFQNVQALEKTGTFADWRFHSGGTEDVDSLKVRRGKVGGYRDYFDARQEAELEAMVAERLDPIYGY